jgi:hypothetical protein
MLFESPGNINYNTDGAACVSATEPRVLQVLSLEDSGL